MFYQLGGACELYRAPAVGALDYIGKKPGYAQPGGQNDTYSAVTV